MGVLRDVGTTKVNVPSLARPTAQSEALLRAVRDAAAGEFEVFGEIGWGAGGTVAYLARILTDGRLVALRLTPDAGSRGEFTLELAKQLDASVPSAPHACPKCHAPLRSWGRFCPNCGLDFWANPPRTTGPSADELLAAVREAARGKFEVLGEISRADGGGVYFGRNLATGRIEALRLTEQGGQEYSVGPTAVLQRVADSLDRRGGPPGGKRTP